MRRLGLVAIAAVVLAQASVVQEPGWTAIAHFSLVRSLTHGTPVVDRYQRETGDLSWYRGHYYAAKAPGLAFFATGPYLLIRRSGVVGLGMRVTGRTRTSMTLWALALVGGVLPVALVLLLVRRIGEDLAAGFGTAAAVTAGLGTLLFPMATLFFDQALATGLAFAAFALLWYRGHRPMLVAAAGLLAGYATTTEYPVGIVAVALGIYAISRGEALRRGCAYAAGLLLGVLPLFLYNQWAFGSPLHMPYAEAIYHRGVTGHDVLGANGRGLFGVAWPSFDTAARLLFGRGGLFTAAPVLLAGLAGLILLYRTGRKREAVLSAALFLVFVTYNSGYYQPFGGGAPGPRFLTAVVPFLAYPLALAYRAWPWPTVALAIPSLLDLGGVTVTNATGVDAQYLSAWTWVHRVADGTFAGYGARPVVPVVVFAAIAVVLTVVVTPWPRPARSDLLAAGALLGAWLLTNVARTRPLGDTRFGFLLLGMAALVYALLTIRRSSRAPARHAGAV